MEKLMLTTPVTIRPTDHTDSAALMRLAQLDSAEPIDGAALVAEYGSRPVAAVTLDGKHAIADPFEFTQGVLTLLRTWAEELRSS